MSTPINKSSTLRKPPEATRESTPADGSPQSTNKYKVDVSDQDVYIETCRKLLKYGSKIERLAFEAIRVMSPGYKFTRLFKMLMDNAQVTESMVDHPGPAVTVRIKKETAEAEGQPGDESINVGAVGSSSNNDDGNQQPQESTAQIDTDSISDAEYRRMGPLPLLTFESDLEKDQQPGESTVHSDADSDAECLDAECLDAECRNIVPRF